MQFPNKLVTSKSRVQISYLSDVNWRLVSICSPHKVSCLEASKIVLGSFRTQPTIFN
jgi:hypothetical protein